MRPCDVLGPEALPPCSITQPDEAGDRIITNERGDWRWLTSVDDADDVWLPGPRYTPLEVSIEGLTPERIDWLLITSRESRESWIAVTLPGPKAIASAPARAKVLGVGDNAEEMRASLIAHEEAEKAREQADRVVAGFLEGLVKAGGAQRVDRPSADAFEADVSMVLDDVRAMLLAKNAAYGDSALSPLRVFSKADPAEQIRVRIDDKLSRLARGSQAGEDTIGDLLGYLVLLRVAEMRAKRSADGGTT